MASKDNKNAGAVISHPFGSVIRSLLVAIYELGVEDIMVIAHSDCGAHHMDSNEILERMKTRGIREDLIEMIRFCGVDFDSWLGGFDDTRKSVSETVDSIIHHPLIPSDVHVHGFIIDSLTGELTRLYKKRQSLIACLYLLRLYYFFDWMHPFVNK